MEPELIAKILQIVVIDLVLSGDNAVVIAMAAHRLPDHQRKKAILWGGGIAIAMRIMFTMIMAFLLMVPGVRFVGGIVLVWIACKLLMDEDDGHEIDTKGGNRSTWAAIRMIFVADFVMSLDNMLAVAGAGGEDFRLLVLGLIISIIIIMTCSSVIAGLMNRYHWIVYFGAGILAYTAGEMIMGDRELAGYFARTHHVSLNSKWEEDFMLTREQVAEFKKPDDLPPDLKDVVKYHNRKLEFIGQMADKQRDALLARVDKQADKEAIELMYQKSYLREVPNWVPAGLRPRVHNWFQRKWPADVWKGIRGRQYHFVAWIFYGAVVAFCLGFPAWLRKHSGRLEGIPGKPEPPKT
jgi:YjbE family integral membrane protein